MKSHQQLTEKHLIFDSRNKKSFYKKKQPFHSIEYTRFWSDRLILLNGESFIQNHAFFHFAAIDLLTNEKRTIRFLKSGGGRSWRFDVFSLNSEFGIITESTINTHICRRINFVKLNWDTNEFELIDKFYVKLSNAAIIVNQLDSSKFILEWGNHWIAHNYQFCKVVNGKPEFGKISQFEYSAPFYRGDQLVDVSSEKIITYDLKLKKEYTYKLDNSLMGRCSAFPWHLYGCTGDFFFAKTARRDNWGIACADLTQRKWKLLRFETNLPIEKFHFFNGNLIVEAKDCRIFSHKIYGIQMKKPQFLRQSAWLLVVQVMKQNGKKNPYKSAKKFLPLNSDLRESWFKDEVMPKSKKSLKIVKVFKSVLNRIHFGSKSKKSG